MIGSVLCCPTDSPNMTDFFHDILAMNRDVAERIRNDHRVVSVVMVPDDDMGTVWLIHLQNGETYWSGAGLFNMAIRHPSGHYRVCPTPQRPSVHPTGGDPEMIVNIEKWIRRQHPEIDNWLLDDDIVLYGLVQAGKTELIMSMIWITQYIYKLPCVLVLANMASSYNQILQKNTEEFNEMLIEEFGRGAIFFKLTPVGLRKNVVNVQIDNHLTPVVMSNPAQLRRLINVVRGKKYVLFSDEADVHVKGWNDDADTTMTGPLIKKLQQEAVGSVKITATPFALYNQQGVCQKTIVMNKPNNYRGLLETEWMFSNDDDANGPS